MFTGIVHKATVVAIDSIHQHTGKSLVVELPHANEQNFKVGASFSMNGCCLTLITQNKNKLTFEVGPETLNCTNLGDLKKGDGLNVEMALKCEDHLDGHMVSGHIDSLGCIAKVKRDGMNTVLSVQVDKRYRVLLIPKGSVAVNGVSLTINHIDNTASETVFDVALLPYTAKETNLGDITVGTSVNIEFDVVGKYLLNHFITKDELPALKGKMAHSLLESDKNHVG